MRALFSVESVPELSLGVTAKSSRVKPALAATHAPGVLDTLAAAYAETGQFEKAMAVQKEALALKADATLEREFESHLSYESGKPWRK